MYSKAQQSWQITDFMYTSEVRQAAWDTMSERALHGSVGNPNWSLILGFCGSGSYLPVGSGSWSWQRARGRWFQHGSAARLTTSITCRQSLNAPRQLTYTILLSAAVTLRASTLLQDLQYRYDKFSKSISLEDICWSDIKILAMIMH